MLIKYLLGTRVWIQHFGYTLLFNLCDRRNTCEVIQGAVPRWPQDRAGSQKDCLVGCPLGWGEERGWRLKYTNAWQWDLESFRVGEHISVLGLRVAGRMPGEGMQACTSLPYTCLPYAFYPRGCSWTVVFLKKRVNVNQLFSWVLWAFPANSRMWGWCCGRKGKITIMWWPWACDWHLKCKWSCRTESLNLCYMMLKPGSVRTELNYWHLVGIRELENLCVSEQTEIPSLQNL